MNKTVKSLLQLGAAIIVISVAMLVNCHFKMKPGSSLTFCKSHLKDIGTAMEAYSTDFSGKYPSDLDKLTPKYMKTLPECEAAGKVSYKLYTGQGPANNPGYEDYYYLECHGQNHSDSGIRGHYPAYDGISGLLERP